MQFNSILDNIKDIVTGEADDKNVLTVSIEEGTISVNKNNFDRTILMYSYDQSLYFSVSELENIDNQFVLNINEGTIENVHIFPIKDDGEIGNEIGSQYTPPLITLNSDVFDDKMVIFLNNTTDTTIKGKIWLFDSDPLLYKLDSAIGSHRLYLEKGGIIYIKNGKSQVNKLFNIYLEDDSFGLHVLQTISSKSFSAGPMAESSLYNNGSESKSQILLG
jgi:hypothetical protein